jgi:hypothetical protein
MAHTSWLRSTIVAFMVAASALACGSPDASDESSTSDELAANGTQRPWRYVLIQAENDSAQAARFRALPNATLVTSYEAGIAWSANDAKPSVQDKMTSSIEAALTRIEAQIQKLETQKPGYEETIVLAIAGHSGGESVFGHTRVIDPPIQNVPQSHTNYVTYPWQEIERIVSTHPTFKKNVRALLLLGCNLGHQDKMDHWRKPFANVVAVAGFNSRAPAGANGSNVMVTMAISAWQKLGVLNRGAAFPADPWAVFADLRACRDRKPAPCMGTKTNGYAQGSVAWEFVDSGNVYWDAVFPPSTSTTVAKSLANAQLDYDQYLGAIDDAHADPPLDTSAGAVRQYNTLSQQYLSALAGERKTPTAADVTRTRQSLRLTLFRTVLEAWTEANPQLVSDLGLDKAELVTWTRRDVLAAIHGLPASVDPAKKARIVKALVELDATEIPDAYL